MATQTANLPYDSSTVANYKAIMMQFGIALAAFGWVQTADTGQVVWSGVTTLPGNGVFRDWEIWRMNDAAQGTMPVFMKLEYSQQATNGVEFRVTVGGGSNGTGTITGLLILGATVFFFSFGTSSLGASTVIPCYYSGSTGRFTCLLWLGQSVEFTFSIERSKDTTGADTTEFVVVTGLNYQNGNNFQNTGTLTGFTAGVGRCLGFQSNTNNIGGVTAACPQFAITGKVSNPLMGLCFTPIADVGQGSTVNVNIYAATHTYIVTKTITNNNGPSAALGLGGNTTAVLVRFE